MILQVSYTATNLQGNITYDSAILEVDRRSNSSDSSYIWTDLTQSEYQFSVVAFTAQGPGETASLMLLRLPGKLVQELLLLNPFTYSDIQLCKSLLYCTLYYALLIVSPAL